MRLQFVEGKQKELIRYFKDEKGLTWKQLADFLGIKQGRLQAYVEETSLIPNEICKKLDFLGKYAKFVIKEKEDNWGKSKGGINSKGNTKKVKLPGDSIKLAEFYGIMLGDGNSHRTKYYKSRDNKRGVYMIRIVGDSRLDKIYLLNYVKPLMENLFDIRVKVGKFKPKEYFKNSKNAMYIVSYGVRLVEFLEKKGFPPGDKIKNKLKIPDWIKEDSNYLRFCLRGLFDTDGSVYKLTKQNSHQISLTSHNPPMLKDVMNGLISLGIICSKISNGRKIYITKKSEIRKFLKLVGFSNDRHLKKIRMWKLDKIAP